ncbi:MAG TPA: UrcA family protein [Caulobacteraceae bacterium]|jgi:UrcA family protein|nr:UrcA family protein [Caulobacteraceae bacterium]
MTRTFLFAGLASALALAAGTAAAQYYGDPNYPPPPAYAPSDDYQPAYSPNDYQADTGYTSTGEITVYARPRTRYGSPLGTQEEVFRESRVVHSADLDLSTYDGARAMRWRIERAARSACAELDRHIAVSADAPRDCYDRAVRDAMTDAEYRIGFTPPNWPDYG